MIRLALRFRFLGLGVLLGLAGLSPLNVAAATPGPAPHQDTAAPLDSGWATQVVVGTYHTCALTVAGGVKCWGDNTYGQLGDGSHRPHLLPVDVVGLASGVAQLSAGDAHICALTTQGAVKCWGLNDHGQLGDGTTTARATPVPVAGLTGGVRAISAGGWHAVALLADGRILSWGDNDHGQLGDGTTVDRLTPVAAAGFDAGAQAISAGDWHTCAVSASGGAWCWGDNSVGALGDGTFVGRPTPAPVVGLAAEVAAVSAGGWHTCAVIAGGGAKCWGENASGQLGRGGPWTWSKTPVDVVGLGAGVAAVSAGRAHTCAVTTGGAQCWGWNAVGQLGDGTTTSHAVPVPVVGLAAGVRGISAGGGHSCAVLEPGEVRCWGDNTYGQLGDGTTTTRLTPVTVALDLPYDCAAAPEIPANECAALVTLFKAANGPSWRIRGSWLATATPCHWYGVTCAAGHVSRLSLPANGLGGALPAVLAEAAALPALQALDLHDNDLDGPVPAALGADLPALRTLNLAGNRLSGPLPASLGQWAELQSLDLDANALSGSLPASLGQLAQLQTLDLHTNALSGLLPAELGRLTTLTTLDLHANALSGPLPEELGRLAALRYLDLGTNLLEGPIPATLGDLAALQHLDLSHNTFADNAGQSSANYHEAVARLTALRYLDLSYNRLSGSLPWWPALSALQHLDLSHNAFQGNLPVDVAQLPNLTYLALHTNHLSGGIPPAWGQLGAQLTFTPTQTIPPPGVYIDLSGNHLFGAIPAGLGQNPAIMGLQLSGNQLSGPVPVAITARRYYFLDLDYNQLVADAVDWYWVGTQTVAPADLQAAVTAEGVVLTWAPLPYYSPEFDAAEYDYEISYATAPDGPFTVHGRTAPNQFDAEAYALTDLPPGATYYFRVRTFTAAHSYHNYARQWVVFDHDYMQPNNLWSDYTPLVSVTLGGTETPTPTVTPTAWVTPTPSRTPGPDRRFLPLVWR